MGGGGAEPAFCCWGEGKWGGGTEKGMGCIVAVIYLYGRPILLEFWYLDSSYYSSVSLPDLCSSHI